MSNLYLLLQELDNTDNNTDNNNEICLISGNKINKDKNIKLSCNHIFDYESLVEAFKIQKKYSYHLFICPYCRKDVNGYLPLHSDYEHIKGITSIKNTFFDYWGINTNKCEYILTKGKNKYNKCNKNKKFYNLKYCSLHNKIENKQICNFILTKGKNKGNICGKKCLENINFCKNHNK